MLTKEQIIAQVNERKNQIQQKVGGLTGSQTGTEGRDRLFGGMNNDSLVGLGGDDFISAGLGDDFIDGGTGDDDLFGGLGNDYILGGDGNDKIYGQVGDDLLYGGAGNDTIDGSIGSDVIFGGDGNDNLIGGPNGDPNAPEDFFVDFLIGGNGSDTLNAFGGGTGNLIERDILVGGGAVDANGSITSIDGDGATDIFVLGNANGYFYANAGNDDYAIIYGFEKGVDQLQLTTKAGTSHQFGLTASGNTLVYANLATGPDLIAIVAGVNLLS